MKFTLSLLFFCFCVHSHSQIKFEAGYYITNAGEKVDCLVKNMDWDNNPEKFIFRMLENSEEKIKNATEVKEFGIYEESRYVSALVQLDESSDNTSTLTITREPIFRERRLFLKMLVQGKASLFSFKNGNSHYFLKHEDNTIHFESLIYKRYIPEGITIKNNNRYKQQLSYYLKCIDITERDIKSTKYNNSSLTSIFKKYNSCMNPEMIQQEIKKKEQLFHLTIKPGVRSNGVLLKRPEPILLIGQNPSFETSFDFGNSTNISFGIETEFTFPFNKNKWSVFLEPTFQSYKPKNENTLNSINYKSLEIPLGIKHYLFFTKSKMFFNAGIVLDLPINSDYNTINITGAPSFLYGIGYLFDNNIGIELRRQSTRELLSSRQNISLKYSNDFIILVSYSFL